MTAEAIAKVVSDLQWGRIRLPRRDIDEPLPYMQFGTANTVVDATQIYHSLLADDSPVYMYEDHPCIAPPWDALAVCYVNEHGNVIAMVGLVDNTVEWEPDPANDHELVWADVKWRLNVLIYVGGRSSELPGKMPTTGPCHMWQMAIGAQGEPLDLHWVHLMPDYPMVRWDMASLVMLGALNFLNCTNVEAVVPSRPRAERRRLERIGVNVHTLSVFPTGRTSAGARGEPLGVPLTSVRGHFARYGPQPDGTIKGLLFGRLAGRFWIPQHARGSEEHGVDEHDYLLRTER